MKLTLGVSLLALAQSADGDAWPQFRGPRGAAHAADASVPSEFALDDVLWRVELPGIGKSSPVVFGARVYSTSVDGDVRSVVCLDAADGATLWTRTFPFDSFEYHELNGVAGSTPAVDELGLYLLWVNGSSLEAIALDHDGEERWRRELGSYASRFGGGRSPIVVDDVVVIANDNDSPESFLVGLDRTSGETLWRRDRKSERASFSTPAVQRPADGPARVLFSSTAHGITCLDAASGELVWELDGLFEERCVAMPALDERYLFANSGKGGGGVESVVLRLREDGELPEMLHRPRRALPYVPAGIFHGPHLFLWNDGGIVSCLDAESGESLWRERVGGEYFGSPVAVGDRLFAVSKAGELVCIAAASELEVLGRTDLGEPADSTPAVAGGVLYLRTERHMIAVGPAAAAREQ